LFFCFADNRRILHQECATHSNNKETT
jgi:hypothetical protein